MSVNHSVGGSSPEGNAALRSCGSEVRNITLAGHAGSGKTSLVEAILYISGCTDRQGKVDDNTTLLDFDSESVKRKTSVQLGLAHSVWDKRNLTWVDTPGAPDFAGDLVAALRATDDILLVTPPVTGHDLEFGFESAFDQGLAVHKAEAIFINKMDRENADFFGTLNALRERFGKHIVPAVLPIGAGASFSGIIDLVTQTAWVGSGRELQQRPILDDLQAVAQEWRQQLVELAAEGDDELIEEFLEGQALTETEIERGIHEDLLGRRIVPVFCGSATQCIGIQPLLTHLAMEFEGPEEVPDAEGTNPQTGKKTARPCTHDAPFSALVFKTIADPYVGKITCFRVLSGMLKPEMVVWNANRDRFERIGPLFRLRGKQQEPVQEVRAGEIAAVAKLNLTETGDTLCDRTQPILYPPIEFPKPRYVVAAHAKTKADEDKWGNALARVMEEDPCFHFRRDEETGETLLEGLGETHLDVVLGRLARFGANVEISPPRIAYRETLSKSARAQGRHKKQTGGRGQFGDCWLTVEPMPSGAGFEFVDKIVGGVIPRQYIPAIEKGVREAMARGVAAGYPIQDVRVTVDDGSFHTVDSSEAAFHMAGVLAFHNAAKLAGVRILEPILEVAVTIPDGFLGDVVGDLSSRRGHVVGIEPAERTACQTVRAHVPAATMQRYVTDLRSLARGRGEFCSSVAHYSELPPNLAEPLISLHERKKAEGTA
jgi:elongation factor G